MNEKETVIVLPCDRKTSFAIGFIYSNRGNFVLKGDFRLIAEEISINYRESLYYVLQGDRRKARNTKSVISSRSRWQFHPATGLLMEVSITRHKRLEYKVMYIRKRDSTGFLRKSLVTSFKTIPKKWLPEYDIIRGLAVH